MSEITIKKSTAIWVLLVTVLASSYLTYVVASNKVSDCPVTVSPAERKKSILDGQQLQEVNTRDGKRF